MVFVTPGRPCSGSVGSSLANADAFCASSAHAAFLGGAGAGRHGWRRPPSMRRPTSALRQPHGWIRVDGRPVRDQHGQSPGRQDLLTLQDQRDGGRLCRAQAVMTRGPVRRHAGVPWNVRGLDVPLQRRRLSVRQARRRRTGPSSASRHGLRADFHCQCIASKRQRDGGGSGPGERPPPMLVTRSSRPRRGPGGRRCQTQTRFARPTRRAPNQTIRPTIEPCSRRPWRRPIDAHQPFGAAVVPDRWVRSCF